MTDIRQEDFIQSVADALQYISYYHPVDYIRILAAATASMHDPAWYQRGAAQMQADTTALSQLQARLDQAYARWNELE